MSGEHGPGAESGEPVHDFPWLAWAVEATQDRRDHRIGQDLQPALQVPGEDLPPAEAKQEVRMTRETSQRRAVIWACVPARPDAFLQSRRGVEVARQRGLGGAVHLALDRRGGSSRLMAGSKGFLIVNCFGQHSGPWKMVSFSPISTVMGMQRLSSFGSRKVPGGHVMATIVGFGCVACRLSCVGQVVLLSMTFTS